MKKLLLTLGLCMLLLTACSSSILGSFSGDKYSNSKIGISFEKPNGWSVTANEKLYTDITAMNTAIGQTVDSNVEKSLNDLQVLRLFVISKGSDEADKLADYYPQFTCIAEKRKIASDETTEVVLKDYMNNFLKRDDYNMQGDASIITVNGTDYYVSTAKKTKSSVTYYRTLYTAYKDGKIITFDYTALDENKNDLNYILKTLTIK